MSLGKPCFQLCTNTLEFEQTALGYGTGIKFRVADSGREVLAFILKEFVRKSPYHFLAPFLSLAPLLSSCFCHLEYHHFQARTEGCCMAVWHTGHPAIFGLLLSVLLCLVSWLLLLHTTSS